MQQMSDVQPAGVMCYPYPLSLACLGSNVFKSSSSNPYKPTSGGPPSLLRQSSTARNPLGSVGRPVARNQSAAPAWVHHST